MSLKRILIGSIGVIAIGGVAYLATLGCCQLMALGKPTGPSLSDQLQLSKSQRQAVAPLEKQFLAQKQSSCQVLCQKRAQLIRLLEDPKPDPGVLGLLTEEIGKEQTALEKGTLDYLLTLRQYLDSDQSSKLVELVSEQLRTACQKTACGVTPGCFVTEGGQSR